MSQDNLAIVHLPPDLCNIYLSFDVYPAAQIILQQSNHSHVMQRRVFLVERFIHMLVVIRIFTTHLFPTEYFLPFVITMLVLQHHKEGLTPFTLLLLPLLALQVWAELSGMEQLQYVVAILGGVLHFLPMRVYWLPKSEKVVGYRQDSLEGGLHYCEFHPLQGETKLKSIRWHREKQVAKMLQHQGFTNKLVKKLGHLILSYVNQYHLQVAEGKEQSTGSAIAFCHGRGGTPFMYSSYLMHFAAQGYRVGAIQHTEMGKTDLVGKEVIKKFREREVQVRAAEYYQTILEVSKGKQRLVLMGHSYGCATIIQAYHSLQPEIKAKVSQLILLDPWFFPLNQAKFAQEISCPVLILANEDFLMNPDMYQRNVSYVKQHKLQYIIWRQGHHNHQTDFGFISGNLLGAVKHHHLSKLFLELNITAIERFFKGERVEGTFGDRELGREWKPEKFYPENSFNM